MATAREQAEPVFAALASADVNAAGTTARIPVQLRDTIVDLGSQLLDALEAAQSPHDERLQEASGLLRDVATYLLGPGERDTRDLPAAARNLRAAAGVPLDADINTFLQTIARMAEIYSRPEYGPTSRWQALRDQIDSLTAAVADRDQELVDCHSAMAQQQTALDAARARVSELTAERDGLLARNASDGLKIIALLRPLNEAVWNDTEQTWMITDAARTEALDA